MADQSRSGESSSYLDRIDGELVGWRGMTRALGDILVLLMVPISVIVSVLSQYIDEERLDSALEMAVDWLPGWPGLVGLVLAARFAGRSFVRCIGEDESAKKRIVALAAVASCATLATIFTYRLLPVGDLSRLLGAAAVVMVLSCFAIVPFGGRVIAACDKLSSAKPAERRNLPSFQKSAWVVDMVVWLSLILLAAVIWSSIMRATGSQRVDSTYFWVLVTGTAMFHAAQICFLGFRGQSPGHQIARVRVVNASTGEPIGWRRTVLRTSIPLFFIYIVLVFEFYHPLGMDAAASGAKYAALITASVIVITASILSFLSYLMLREVHAHGQGLLDLMCRTVSVTLKDPLAEASLRSTTLSEELQGADRQ